MSSYDEDQAAAQKLIDELLPEEAEQAEANAKAEAYRLKYLEGVRYMLADRRGWAFLREMFNRCGIFDGGFEGDPNALQYRSGKQAVGLRLLDDVTQADKAAYIKMLSSED